MNLKNFWPQRLSALFAAELAWETNKYGLMPGQARERAITELPDLLQGHLRTCGFAGRESVVCCRLTWKNAFLKFKTGGGWSPLECLQVNFVPSPARLVLMNPPPGFIYCYGQGQIPGWSGQPADPVIRLADLGQ